MKLFKAAAVSSIVLLGFSASFAETCTSRLRQVFTEGYNAGWAGDVIFTTVSTTTSGTNNCNGGNFVIENAQAGKSTVMSNALAAAAQGKEVVINWLPSQKKDVYAKIMWLSVLY